MGGARQNDLFVCPACRECHGRCAGLTVNGKPPIPVEEQARAVERNQIAFLLEASPEQWNEVGQDRARWFARQVFVDF